MAFRWIPISLTEDEFICMTPTGILTVGEYMVCGRGLVDSPVTLISESVVCVGVCVWMCAHICVHHYQHLHLSLPPPLTPPLMTLHPYGSPCVFSAAFLLSTPAPVRDTNHRWGSLKAGGKRSTFGCDFSATMEFRTKSKTLLCDWQSPA